VFFLTGMTLAISGATTGGFALIIGFSCALIFRRLSAVFVLVPAALIAFGFLFGEFEAMTAFNAAAYGLPAFLAFTFGTRISFVRRTVEIRGRKVRSVPSGKSETAPEVGTLIRPDFARPPIETPVPEPARQVIGERVMLPDFLRIAEEPVQPRRRERKRLFPRRGGV
jgi:hypothetical protein